MKKVVLLAILLIPLMADAQQPKMYIKAFTGINTVQFVYRIEDVDTDILAGWQLGLGFRVSKRRAFAEFDITYVNSGITFSPQTDTAYPFIDPLTLRVHSLEVPLLLGYIPVKTPVFKWFLYGGVVNKFSLRGRIKYEGETYKYKPKELDLPIWGLGARFGTQVDVAMFNFDFNYTISITNALQGRPRTNSHALQLSIGFLF